MINSYLKKICLISFALFAPIYLPGGGIQRNLNDNLWNKKEIVINSKCYVYCMPFRDSNKILTIEPGTSLSILQLWANSDKNKWVRVKIARNIFVDNFSLPSRGWIQL